MGLKVELTLPPKYYKERIAEAKKAGDMKKSKRTRKTVSAKRKRNK